jgi:ABC-type uncharacterized transport system substrate-binding protein
MANWAKALKLSLSAIIIEDSDIIILPVHARMHPHAYVEVKVRYLCGAKRYGCSSVPDLY